MLMKHALRPARRENKNRRERRKRRSKHLKVSELDDLTSHFHCEHDETSVGGNFSSTGTKNWCGFSNGRTSCVSRDWGQCCWTYFKSGFLKQTSWKCGNKLWILFLCILNILVQRGGDPRASASFHCPEKCAEKLGLNRNRYDDKDRQWLFCFVLRL